MSRPYDQLAVKTASTAYVGTCGESTAACKHKFIPAFINRDDGEIELARMPNGQPAPMHLISCLPSEWAVRCDTSGQVLELKRCVEAGFVRDGRFFTREEAAQAG